MTSRPAELTSAWLVAAAFPSALLAAIERINSVNASRCRRSRSRTSSGGTHGSEMRREGSIQPETVSGFSPRARATASTVRVSDETPRNILSTVVGWIPAASARARAEGRGTFVRRSVYPFATIAPAQGSGTSDIAETIPFVDAPWQQPLRTRCPQISCV